MKVFAIYKLIIFSIISFCFLYGCTNNQNANICGEITNSPAKSISLQQLSPLQTSTVASAKISNSGKFEININDSVKQLYRLVIGNLQPIYLCIDNSDKVELNIDCQDINNYQISGSHDCQELKRLHTHLHESSIKIKELRSKISLELNLTAAQLSQANQQADSLFLTDKQFIKDFISANYKSPIIYFALRQYVSTTPLMQISTDYETYKFVLENLQKYNPNLAEIRYLQSEINKYELQQSSFHNRPQLAEGCKVPNFALYNENGCKITLEDFVGQAFTICFWSSQDKASVKAINNYKQQMPNAKLLLISLDTNKEQWQKAISMNNFQSATNLSDFKGWESVVVKTFSINKLPLILEINEKGEVVKVCN